MERHKGHGLSNENIILEADEKWKRRKYLVVSGILHDVSNNNNTQIFEIKI